MSKLTLLAVVILSLTLTSSAFASTNKGNILEESSYQSVGNWQVDFNADRGKVLSAITTFKNASVGCGAKKTVYSSFEIINTGSASFGTKHRIFKSAKANYNLTLRYDLTPRGWRFFGGSLEPKSGIGNSCLLVK